MLAHLPSTLIPNPGMEGGDLMAEATQFDPDRLRAALDHGEVVELYGGTLVLDGEDCCGYWPWYARWTYRTGMFMS